MKKIALCTLIIAIMLTALVGCGSNKGGETSVDLQAFIDDTQGKYELGSIMPVEDEEMLSAFYPGLAEIETTQRIAYMPMITGRVSEYIFLECTNEADVEKAAGLLQTRVDEQAAGGAFYPESVEAWTKAKVLTHGNYVLLIAAGDNTDSIAADFEALF